MDPATFGTTGAVPLEVVQFGSQATRLAVLSAVITVLRGRDPQAGEDVEKAAANLGVSAVYRHHKGCQDLFVTDNGNFCLDLFFRSPIPDAEKLHEGLIRVNPNT